MSQISRRPLEPGDRVDKYLVLDEIGSGGTGIVYEAIHERLGSRVAIKVLRPDMHDPSSRLRFQGEMRLLASVASGHVPQAHDVGWLPNGLPYVVMERLDGDTLADRLSRRSEIPIAEAVELTAQLCSALAAVHAAGVVHRDVKPENLVLHEEPDGTRVLKLFDFGICKWLDDDDPRLTQPGKTVGTPDYMSPEQARGLVLGPRSDLYSAGVVLYEMIAGRCPFEDPDPRVTLQKATTQPPPSLRQARPQCSAALERVVFKALAKRSDRRYASATQMRRALLEVAETLGAQEAAIDLRPRRPSSARSTVTEGGARPQPARRRPAPSPRRPRRDSAGDSVPPPAQLPTMGGRWWGRAAAAALVVGGIGWIALDLSGSTEAQSMQGGLQTAAETTLQEGAYRNARPEPLARDRLRIDGRGVDGRSVALLDTRLPADGEPAGSSGSPASPPLDLAAADGQPAQARESSEQGAANGDFQDAEQDTAAQRRRPQRRRRARRSPEGRVSTTAFGNRSAPSSPSASATDTDPAAALSGIRVPSPPSGNVASSSFISTNPYEEGAGAVAGSRVPDTNGSTPSNPF